MSKELANMSFEEWLDRHLKFGCNEACLIINTGDNKFSKHFITTSYLLDIVRKAKELDEYKTLELKEK